MRTLNAADQAPARRPAGPGPGPSKLSYRLARAWAKPAVRNSVTVYLPLALLGLVGWRLAADDGVRMAVEARIAAVAESFAARPEFAVTGLAVTGASEDVRAAITRAVGLTPGLSSLRLDLDRVRADVEALGPVAAARVRLSATGMLEVHVRERVPRALWRDAAGVLRLVDEEGVAIGTVTARAGRPDLPLILGEGAPARVPEAMALVAAAPDLVPRVRALVLVGERRWDLVLAGDLRVLLPERGAVEALQHVIALDRAEDLLSRDLAAVDMRVEGRPTLRLTPRAMERYRERREAEAKTGSGT